MRTTLTKAAQTRGDGPGAETVPRSVSGNLPLRDSPGGQANDVSHDSVLCQDT